MGAAGVVTVGADMVRLAIDGISVNVVAVTGGGIFFGLDSRMS